MTSYAGAKPSSIRGTFAVSSVSAPSRYPVSCVLGRTPSVSSASLPMAVARPEIPILHWALPESPSDYGPSSFVKMKDKILITPLVIDAGLVLAAKHYTVSAWSTHKYWKKLLSWSETGLDQVDVTNADGAPCWYGPWKTRDYDVTFKASGQATVSGSIHFTFQGAPAPSVYLTGTRLIAWSFEPNWAVSPVESLEWFTDVLQAYNHQEQRIRLRQNPRRAMKYSFLMDGARKIGTMHNDLYGWINRVFAVPIWTDWQNLGADYAVGTSIINIPTANLDINAGQLMMLWASSSSNEIVEVQSMTANSITLIKPTNSSWKRTDRIIPCRLGRASNRIPISYRTGRAIEAEVTFSFEPKTGVGSNRLGTNPYTTLMSGLPVLKLAPEPDVSMDLDADLLTVDGGKGGWQVYSKGDNPSFGTNLRWVLSGRQAISDFLAWLDYCKGRLTPFWMPSWQNELEIAQNVAASDISILAKKSDLAKFIGINRESRKYIVFVMPDRTMLIRTITSVGESGDNEVIGISSSLGTSCNKDSFLCVSFLRYARLDADLIEMNWHSKELLECTIPVKEIPVP